MRKMKRSKRLTEQIRGRPVIACLVLMAATAIHAQSTAVAASAKSDYLKPAAVPVPARHFLVQLGDRIQRPGQRTDDVGGQVHHEGPDRRCDDHLGSAGTAAT